MTRALAEIYVYVTSAGSGSVRFAGDNLGEPAQISERDLPASRYAPHGSLQGLTADGPIFAAGRGYSGSSVSRFTVTVRTNTTPTGEMLQFQYKLIMEAGWFFRIDSRAPGSLSL